MRYLGELFRDWAGYKRVRNKMSKLTSTQLLVDLEVPFLSRNDGERLIVQAEDSLIDFYPSSGVWIHRSSKVKRLGVFRLLRFIGVL